VDAGSIATTITATGIGIVGGAVVRPYLDRQVRHIHERLEARIDGYDVGGETYIASSYFVVEDVARYDDLTASFLQRVEYAKYAAIVAVRNVKGQDVERLSVTIGFDSFLLPCPPELGGRIDSDLPLLEESKFRTRSHGLLNTVTKHIEYRLAVTDEAPIAQFAFFGPKSGDFTFRWRLSANGMAHPPRDFGKQRLHLRSLQDISTLLEEQALTLEKRARRGRVS